MAYQHEKYIRQALDALAAQSCQSFKLIAIDDGSTDDTYLILKEYESGILRRRMTVLTHPGHLNCGIYAGYRRCLENLDTEFFMPHASDDLLKPGGIAYLLGLMDRNPGADFAYGPCTMIDAYGMSKGKYDGTEDVGEGLDALQILLGENQVREPTMFFRARCSHVITQDHSNIVYGDWLHNLIFFTAFKPLRYSFPVSLYRVHEFNVSLGKDADKSSAQRRRAVFLAAISNQLLAADKCCRLLILLFGINVAPAMHEWPSPISIAREIASIPSRDISTIVRCLNRNPPQVYNFPIVLALVLRAPLMDGLSFGRRYLSSSLALLYSFVINGFKNFVRSAIRIR